MTRYLKTLGLALVASFALSAMVASAASAEEQDTFSASSAGAIEASAVGVQVFEPTTGSKEGYECKKLSVKGEVAKEAKDLTVTPDYSECQTFGGESKVTVDFIENGCHKLYTGTTTAGNPTGGEHANYHIQCPGEKAMEINVTGFKLKCAAIGTQEIKHAVRYQNINTPEGKTHIEVKGTAHGLRTTTVGVCGEGEHNNGGTTGNFTVTRPGGSISVTKSV